MKTYTKSKSIVSLSLFSTLALITGSLLVCGINASALEYQTTADVGFTFRPFINVNLSGDLVINNLTPGSYADSNIITVGVSTNASNGYVMQATAGTNTTNTRLVNTDNSNFYFSSLGTSDTVTSMNSASDNTWGYSYSIDNGTNWISAPGTSGYSGLPQDANTNANERGKGGKTLLDTDGTTGNQSIKFKIGAKAATTQAAGTYTNTINFYAVAYAAPESLCGSNQYEMQEVSTWESTVTSGNEVTACDNRDGKTYTVARLGDGNLWMTQNLDFDIVDGGADLDSTNTDVPSNWADAGNLTNTYATNNTSWFAVSDSYSNPESYDPGDVCWDGIIDTSYSGNLANNTTTCTSSNIHYHIGNYYNWTAAVAMEDSSSYTTNDEDVDQSICPAGWTLPKSGSNTSSGSFAYLVDEASLIAGTSGNIHTSPYYFVYGGGWNGSSYVVGGLGFYWSSVVNGDYYAYRLDFSTNGFLYPDLYANRDTGISVRCVARPV